MPTLNHKKLVEHKIQFILSLMQSSMTKSMEELATFISHVDSNDSKKNLELEYECILSEKDCPLTRAELRVLEYWANHDFNINTCADHLHISSVTAHQHIAKARQKMGVHENQCLFKMALINGWILLRDSDGQAISPHKPKFEQWDNENKNQGS